MPRSDLTSDVDLRDYGQILLRRKGIIIASVLVVVMVAAGVTLAQPKVYEASAEVRLQTPDTTGSTTADPSRSDMTEIQVIKSDPVRADAARRLKVQRPPDVSVSQISGSDIVKVKSRAPDAQQATAAANALTSAYIAFRRQQAVDQLTAATSQLQARVDALRKQIAAARTPEPGKASDPVVQRLVDQQTLFQQRLDQLQVEAAFPSGGPQLVAAAAVPPSPIAPKPARNVLLALIAGLVLGIGLALLADVLDDAIRNGDDLARVNASLPMLGLVPIIPRPSRKGDEDGLLQKDLNSPAGEAYRSLRTSLQLVAPDATVSTILVSSPLGGEGKTTTAANLGLAFARTGKRVILVDCDLRRPRLHTLFDLDNEVGLTTILAGDATAGRAIQRVPGEPYMRLLASGPLPPAPPELIAAQRTTDLLKDLAGNCDIVLLDSPPLLPVTDAVLLAEHADITVLVISAGTTTRRQTQRAIDLISQVDTSRSGAVLNRVATDLGRGYTYSSYGNLPPSTPTEPRNGNYAGGRERRHNGSKTAPSNALEWSPAIDYERPVG